MPRVLRIFLGRIVPAALTLRIIQRRRECFWSLVCVIALRRGVIDARWTAMYVIELIYKADLADIDANMDAHVAFLKKY